MTWMVCRSILMEQRRNVLIRDDDVELSGSRTFISILSGF